MMKNLLRLAVIWWRLWPEYRALRAFAREKDSSAPGRLVTRLLGLGPAFVKLGQILSTRPDLLPQAYIDALSRLQEDGPKVPAEVIRATIEGELGKSVESLFAAFEQVPAATASLAQVHRAALKDGRAVAVKVQRPNLDRLVLRDLNALEYGLNWLCRLFPRRMRRTNLEAFFREFRRYTLQELDFAQEGHIIDRFRANFAGRSDVKFPTVHWHHTGRRVLTMDWVEGMRLHEAAATLGMPERQRLVTLLVDVMLQMFISDGLFHADLHPGNIFFHPDGTFTLLDFGMYGELTAPQRDRFILYWFAVVQRQPRRAFHHFKAQTHSLEGADEKAFFKRFAALADEFYASRLSEVSFAKVYLAMMKAGYDYRFVFPSELMLHAKALTTAEALIFVLAPDARFERLSRPFIAREYAKRTASLDLLKRRISQLAPELLLLGEFLPSESLDDAWDWDSTLDIGHTLSERFQITIQSALEQAGFWRTLLEPHARAVLQAAGLGESVDGLLQAAWDRYYQLEPSIGIEENLGAVFTTHLAAATLALHESLVRHRIPPREAYRLIYQIGWKFYRQMAEPPLLMASTITRDPRKRLRLATSMFRTFPFGAPSYRWRDVTSSEGAVAFDCLRCPVAEFFAKHAASELCAETWCKLDFPLAEKWGGHLKRSGTIATGAVCCDFRWYANEREPGFAVEAPAKPLGPAGQLKGSIGS